MIRRFLESEIFIAKSDNLTLSDCARLIQKQEVANLALEKFILGQISFQDYIDILETCEMNIDDYLITVEQNLITCGML
ncbi:hypothetical protein [Mastigocladopsis repens]|uniref:hypothetical protein n=1 Tax=Mastigocladopsis repens TaxID=221287 RepID=UPI0002EB1404|nr:hypothetical protein [Mastigocladopsis repens]